MDSVKQINNCDFLHKDRNISIPVGLIVHQRNQTIFFCQVHHMSLCSRSVAIFTPLNSHDNRISSSLAHVSPHTVFIPQKPWVTWYKLQKTQNIFKKGRKRGFYGTLDVLGEEKKAWFVSSNFTSKLKFISYFMSKIKIFKPDLIILLNYIQF